MARALIDQTYYSMEQIAEAIGFVYRRGLRRGEVNVQMTRRWLKREGAVVKRGRLWYTTKALLRRAFDDADGEWLSRLPE